VNDQYVTTHPNGIEGLTAQAQAAGEWRRDNPEALTTLVLTRDEDDARTIAHKVMNRVYPTRQLGPILHMEQDHDGMWLVSIQDMGPVETVEGER